jgi:ABC-type lipoprotein release transport system permease subunit
LWTIAYRDLGRNLRRSILTLLAVGMGLALTIVMNGLISGMMEEATQNSIRLQTGHVQVRAASYEEEKVSLKWEDLLDDADTLAAQANGMSQVKGAAPVLIASGFINTVDDSVGLRIYGIDVTSVVYEPIWESMVAGEFLTPDDRSGVIIGQRLADTLGLAVGQNVSLTAVNSDGEPEEGLFTIRGLFSTGVVAYDDSTVFMPLSKAQAFTRTDGHASALVVHLYEQSDSDAVAAALAGPGRVALTWEELNEVFLTAFQTAMAFYNLMYGIVILVVAVVIANTLLMAVFERVREIGILASLGMKGRQIMVMFLMEAAVLGVAGILVGLALGSAGVGYLSVNGIEIGEGVAGAAGDAYAIGTTMSARFSPSGMAALSVATLVIILLASLYPAWFAARREPVEALHTL